MITFMGIADTVSYIVKTTAKLALLAILAVYLYLFTIGGLSVCSFTDCPRGLPLIAMGAVAGSYMYLAYSMLVGRLLFWPTHTSRRLLRLALLSPILIVLLLQALVIVMQ